MLLNIVSATCIVFANKLVLSVYKFHFVYALTLIHTVTTMVCLHATSECFRIAQDCTQRYYVPASIDLRRHVHVCTTLVIGRLVTLCALQIGMWTFSSLGLFQSKGLKAMQVNVHPHPVACHTARSRSYLSHAPLGSNELPW